MNAPIMHWTWVTVEWQLDWTVFGQDLGQFKSEEEGTYFWLRENWEINAILYIKNVLVQLHLFHWISLIISIHCVEIVTIMMLYTV